MKIFEKYRPRDINLEIPVGKDGEKLVYYIFNEPALNTFDKNRIEAIVSKSVYTLIREMEIQIRSLKSILDEYLPKGQNIDFMSIDVEGLDFEVLKSNDWKKYRPEILLVESRGGGVLMTLLNPRSIFFCKIKTISFLQKLLTHFF